MLRSIGNYFSNTSFILGFACLLYAACASPVAPTGGPKDERPPGLVKEDSTPNLLTNFNENEIRLTFDEWIKLDRVAQQVIISPPLENNPEIVIRGKTVRFRFNEEEQLKPNTTYSINFGTAIKDITEGNSPENLKYVFSTGDAIDSLSVRGKVVDAKTGEGMKDVLVMLYDNLADTVVQKERPYYFSRTNESGIFSIDYVRADTFKVFALKDANLNYLYDRDTEAIGFPGEFLVLDTAFQQALTITLFEPDLPLKITETNYRTYGRLQIGFNQSPDSIELEYPNYFERTSMEMSKDSILLFYDKKTIDSSKWEMVVKTSERILDTLDFRIPGTKDFSKAGRTLKPVLDRGRNSIEAAPGNNPELVFATPIWSVDTSKVILKEDSVETVLPVILEPNKNTRLTYLVEANWKEGKNYDLQFLPDALENIYGLKNDTLNFKVAIKRKKEYGTLKIALDSLDAKQQYLVQLKLGEKKEGAQRLINGRGKEELLYTLLTPGNYSLEIVEDRDKNQRWSSGDYKTKSQPERFMTASLPAVRKNWEVETEVAWEPK